MAGGKNRGQHAAGQHRPDRTRAPRADKSSRKATPPPAGTVYKGGKPGIIARWFGAK